MKSETVPLAEPVAIRNSLRLTAFFGSGSAVRTETSPRILTNLWRHSGRSARPERQDLVHRCPVPIRLVCSKFPPIPQRKKTRLSNGARQGS